jgi:hypothetical protein
MTHHSSSRCPPEPVHGLLIDLGLMRRRSMSPPALSRRPRLQHGDALRRCDSLDPPAAHPHGRARGACEWDRSYGDLPCPNDDPPGWQRGRIEVSATRALHTCVGSPSCHRRRSSLAELRLVHLALAYSHTSCILEDKLSMTHAADVAERGLLGIIVWSGVGTGVRPKPASGFSRASAVRLRMGRPQASACRRPVPT